MRRLRFVVFIASIMTICVGWLRPDWASASSLETVQLDPEKRRALVGLRDEEKFEPHDYPPFGYVGIVTPEHGQIARAAVNGAIESLLSRDDGPVDAQTVSDVIGAGMEQVEMLDTEDRDRTVEYMLEIWYLLGFKGPTGQFEFGAGFVRPEGYGEPLPPGWTSPTSPRSSGRM
jgi:hypothetical protein